MASVPTSIPSFSTIRDDIDYVLAEHQNTPNDEITALATLIGMLGVAQSHSASFLTTLQNYITGCGVLRASASSITVQSGQLVVSNSGGTIRKLRSKTTDSTLTSADLDTGASFTNSTAHYVYATGDTGVTTPVYKISTNASTPTGLTYYRRIGGFYVDSSGDITFAWSDQRPDLRPGETIYERITEDATEDTTGTGIPVDDTAPQTATEGKGYTALDTVIVPTSTTDIIEVELEVECVYAGSGLSIVYLSKNSDASALKTSSHGSHAAVNGTNPHRLIYRYTPASVSPITFKAFFGPESGGTVYVNQSGAGAARFAGTLGSRMKVRVIKGI